MPRGLTWSEPWAGRGAARFGQRNLARETALTPSGRVLTDGPACRGDCEQFKGIAQRHLSALAGVDPRGGWAALVAASAEAVWSRARDPARTTFGVDWAGPPGRATVATQSSAVAALARAACAEEGDRRGAERR